MKKFAFLTLAATTLVAFTPVFATQQEGNNTDVYAELADLKAKDLAAAEAAAAAEAKAAAEAEAEAAALAALEAKVGGEWVNQELSPAQDQFDVKIQGFDQLPGTQGSTAPAAPAAPAAPKAAHNTVKAADTATGTKTLPKTSAVK